MQLATLDFFNNRFSSEQMNFLFSGDFSDELTDQLIELNTAQFESPSELKSLQRKSAFLIAECFQNIVRHSDLTNSDSYFHIKNDKGLFSLISGNSIKSSFAPILQKQLEELNKLTDEELREAFRKTLTEGKFSSKGGAGIGLIEMARKSKNKLRFSFSSIDEIRSYFYFQMLIKKSEGENNCSFESNIELRDIIKQEDLFLVYKGTSSLKVNTALHGIMKPKLQNTDQGYAYFKLTEVLQKMTDSSIEYIQDKSVLLLLGENASHFTFGASCHLELQKAKSLERSFKLFQTYSDERLDSERNQLLLNEPTYINQLQVHLIEFITYSSGINLELSSLNQDTALLKLSFRLKKKQEEPIELIPERKSIFNFLG